MRNVKMVLLATAFCNMSAYSQGYLPIETPLPLIEPLTITNYQGAKVQYPILEHIGAFQLNPGFLNSKNEIIKNSDLQSCVEKAANDVGLKSKYSLMLVNLTGKKKFDPSVAAINPLEVFGGASVPKIAVLLAAHQLRYDTQVFADVNEHFSEDEIYHFIKSKYEISQPKEILTIKKNSEKTDVRFTPRFKDMMTGMIRFSSNEMASAVMKLVTIPYITSVLYTTGIYHKDLGGGLWPGVYYDGKGGYARDPKSGRGLAINALSIARYFTLLHQQRLVSTSDSDSMLSFLYDSAFNNKFRLGLTYMGLKVNSLGSAENDKLKTAKYYRKTGTIYSGGKMTLSHDEGILVRTVCSEFNNKVCVTTKEISYVPVLLTKDESASLNVHDKLISKLDQCIQKDLD